MLTKTLTIVALAAAASAQQMMNLTGVLGSMPQLSNLTSYLGLFPDLVQQLSMAQDITLLAPNNAAFAKLMNTSAGAALTGGDTSMIQALFSYHVLNGTFYASDITMNASFVPTALTSMSSATLLNPASVEAIRMDNQVNFISGLLTQSTVTSPNHNFTGGTIHIIDTVLALPQNISTTTIALNQTSFAGAARMAEIASGSLPSNLTAFVPNNAAFAAIASVVANLSMSDLQGVIAYHILPNVTAYSTDLRNETLTTLAGVNLTITLDGDNVFVNDAMVVTPNILVQEGVVHVIDAVLNPMNSTAKPTMGQSSGMPGYASASSGSMVPFTSGIPTPTSVPTGATGGAGGAPGGMTSSSSGGAAMPMVTGAVGAVALFGGAAMLNM